MCIANFTTCKFCTAGVCVHCASRWRVCALCFSFALLASVQCTVHCALGGFPELASPLPSPLGKAFCRGGELENWTSTYLPSMGSPSFQKWKWKFYSLLCFQKTLPGNWEKNMRAIIAKKNAFNRQKSRFCARDLNQCYVPDFCHFWAALPPVTS